MVVNMRMFHKPLNMSCPNVKQYIRRLHDRLDKAISIAGALQQPNPCTVEVTNEHLEMETELYFDIEDILDDICMALLGIEIGQL